MTNFISISETVNPRHLKETYAIIGKEPYLAVKY